MAFCTMTFRGESLGKQCAMNLIIPDRVKTRKKLCVLYQLHGMSDNHMDWTLRSSIARYVTDLPLMVVMPDGERGFYCDAVEGAAFETHIMKDVMGFVERFFPVRKERRGRAIGGLSMGGYGSMKLALKHPDVFCSVVSHSSAMDFGHAPIRADIPEWGRILGDKPSDGKDDLWTITDRLTPSKAPAIRFDCGKDDGLLDSNRRFHRQLLKRKIKHQYREYPGGHDWGYWDEHVQEALAFHSKHLKL